MTFRIAIRKAAEQDMELIEDWYELQRHGLGVDFRNEVDKTLRRVAARPFSYPVFYRQNRRALLQRFPYKIWFRITGNTIVVLACVHGVRGPGFLRSRLPKSQS